MHRDLDREMAFHVRERADELCEQGVAADEAERLARLQFGNYTVQVERTRDMDINESFDTMARNLRIAARALAKSTGFTITVVATLALGIGANSAVFSAIDAVLLRPLPFPNGDELVSLAQYNPKSNGPFVAPARLEDWNRLNDTFQAISGWYSQDDSELTGELPEKLRHAFVAPRFLQVWGVAPALGRDFSPDEEKFNGPPAVIISDRLWQRRFNADRNVIGKALRIGRNSVPVVGVMPASFLFPEREVDLWSTSPNDAPYARSRELTWYTAVGRLKPGVTIAQARANLATVQASLAREFPKPDADISAVMRLLKEQTIGKIRSSMWVLFGSVTVLLLIACTNVAALLLSRAAGRQHEISVRYSLGASRSSVVAQLLTEVLLLAVAGAGLGLGMAAATSRIFRVLAKDLPRIEEIGLDWRIVMYSLVCALAAAFVCGMYPAIRGTRRQLAGALVQGGRSQVRGRNPVQFALVGVQVALAVTLLLGAGLLVRSFQALGRVSPGFESEHILVFHISTSWAETNDYKGSRQRMLRILDGLRTLPGVEDAATDYDLTGVPKADYRVELKSVEGRDESLPKMIALGRGVSPSYFSTMQIPLLAGEACRDDQPNASMVNRSFVSRYYPAESPIGRHLAVPGNAYIVTGVVNGIVGDARENGIDREPVPTIYWCSAPNQPGSYYLVRTHGSPAAMIETVRRKVHELEPLRSVYGLSPLTTLISDGYAENRLRTILLVFFAMTAVSLACVGLYGTLSYLVKLRQREVGLRLALGAMRAQIVRQFLAQGLVVSAVGCVAGLGLGAATERFLAGMLYGVSASDGPTIAGVVGVIVAVSAMASLIPAVRAARLEPMDVLREE